MPPGRGEMPNGDIHRNMHTLAFSTEIANINRHGGVSPYSVRFSTGFSASSGAPIVEADGSPVDSSLSSVAICCEYANLWLFSWGTHKYIIATRTRQKTMWDTPSERNHW